MTARHASKEMQPPEPRAGSTHLRLGSEEIFWDPPALPINLAGGGHEASLPSIEASWPVDSAIPPAVTVRGLVLTEGENSAAICDNMKRELLSKGVWKEMSSETACVVRCVLKALV